MTTVPKWGVQKVKASNSKCAFGQLNQSTCPKPHTWPYNNMDIFIYDHIWSYMEVSWNRGTPKSSILDWDFPLITIQLWGYPHDYGGFHKCWYPKMDCLCWKILLKHDDLGVPPFLETSICSMLMKQFSSPPGIQQVLGDCQRTWPSGQTARIWHEKIWTPLWRSFVQNT